MLLLFSTFITTVAQLILLFLLVILIWIFTGRKRGVELFTWLGIKRFRWSGTLVKLFMILLILYTGIKTFGQFIIPDDAEAKLLFFHDGPAALVPAFIAAFLQSGLLEETLFRGVIGKNFIYRCGFRTGNLIQSSLFGIYYFVFMIGTLGTIRAFIIATAAACCGYAFCLINEKYANGSILPGWILNSTACFIAYLFIMF